MISTEFCKIPSKKNRNGSKINLSENDHGNRTESPPFFSLPWRANNLATTASLLLLVTVTASAQNHEPPSTGNRQNSATSNHEETHVTYVVPSLTTLPTRVPEDIFTEQPENATVFEGQKVIMRCKTAIPVSYCRWYYLDRFGNFYNHLEKPRLVKEFDPKRKTDCSIRFTKVHPVQEGQWLCEAYGYESTVKYFTRPGLLKVTKDSFRNVGFENTGTSYTSPSNNVATMPTTSLRVQTTMISSNDNISTNDRSTTKKTQSSHDPYNEDRILTLKKSTSGLEENTPNQGSLFQYSEGEYIQNTRTNAMAVIPCQVNGPVETCSWIMPNKLHLMWHTGTEAPITSVDARYYEFAGNKISGNCSLRIRNVSHQDEGNWRCTVKMLTSKEHHRNNDERLGPLLHLHLLDIPHGPRHDHGQPSNAIAIGWAIGVILLLVIVALVVWIIYKKVYRREPNDIEPKNKTSHENSSFDPDYAQKWFHGRDMKIPAPTYSDESTINNNGSFGTANSIPVALPFSLRNNSHGRPDEHDRESARSSANSTSTLMTSLNPDPSRNSESFNSPGRMSNMSNMSPAQLGTDHIPSFRELHRDVQRTESSESAEHVYEEIKAKIQRQASQESYTSIKNPHFITSAPIYNNQLQDQEGYLIPNNSQKIINTPTIVDQDKYLPMTGPMPRRTFSDTKTTKYNIDENNLNFDHKKPTLGNFKIDMESEERRLSTDSNLSNESNSQTRTSNKKDSIFPINKFVDSIQFSNINRSTTPLNMKNSARSLDSLDDRPHTRSAITNPATDRFRHLNSSTHVRASSLPNDNMPPRRTPMTLSPSPMEEYDVPRSPSSFIYTRKSSQISLDNINGTVV